MVQEDSNLFFRYKLNFDLIAPKIREKVFYSSNKLETLKFYNHLIDRYDKKQPVYEAKSETDGCYGVLSTMVWSAKLTCTDLIEKLKKNGHLSLEDKAALSASMTSLMAGISL